MLVEDFFESYYLWSSLVMKIILFQYFDGGRRHLYVNSWIFFLDWHEVHIVFPVGLQNLWE